MGLLALVAVVDYHTGYELQFFIFYFLPIGLAAWYGGRLPGFLVAAVSAACWYWIDHVSGHPYAHWYYAGWNTLIRLSAFLLSAFSVSEIHRLLQREREVSARLTEALAQVKQLKGFIPICANCKKIRNDKGYWEQVERYISTHTDAEFTHGLCPDCHEKLYGPQLRAMEEARRKAGPAVCPTPDPPRLT